MNNTNVYILGPMRGIPHYNFPAFDNMAEEIRRAGLTPVNPAQLDRDAGFNPLTLPHGFDWTTIPADFPLEGIIDRDLAALRKCDYYVCLDGWENSTGAKAEKGVLDWQGSVRLYRSSPTEQAVYGTSFQVMPTQTPPSPPKEESFYEQQLQGKYLKPTNAKDRAATNRLDLSLFPMTAIAYGALGMTEGDCKYGGFNYRPAGVLASTYVAAAGRHMMRWYNGQETDPKTNVPHLASALSCIAIIIDSLECGTLQDDRPPKVDVSKLLERFEQNVKHLHTIFPDGPARFTEKAIAKKS